MSELFFQDDYYTIYTSGRNIDYIQMLNRDFEQLIAEKRLLDTHIIAALYMARSFLEAHP